MKTIGAYEAKTNLSKLLRLVAKGQSFIITKNGTPVAELKPTRPKKKMTPKEAVEAIKKLRKGNILGDLSLRDLIEEGRK